MVKEITIKYTSDEGTVRELNFSQVKAFYSREELLKELDRYEKEMLK